MVHADSANKNNVAIINNETNLFVGMVSEKVDENMARKFRKQGETFSFFILVICAPNRLTPDSPIFKFWALSSGTRNILKLTKMSSLFCCLLLSCLHLCINEI